MKKKIAKNKLKPTKKPSPAELQKMRAMEVNETPADEAAESPSYQKMEDRYGIEKHGKKGH